MALFARIYFLALPIHAVFLRCSLRSRFTRSARARFLGTADSPHSLVARTIGVPATYPRSRKRKDLSWALRKICILVSLKNIKIAFSAEQDDKRRMVLKLIRVRWNTERDKMQRQKTLPPRGGAGDTVAGTRREAKPLASPHPWAWPEDDRHWQ